MRHHAGSGTAAVTLLVAVTLAACGSEARPCAFETIADRGPDATADLPPQEESNLREARLVHEQGGYAFYVGDPVDEQADVCLVITSGDELLSSACGAGWVETTVGTEVRAAYDTDGDVAEVADHLEAVDECLAVRTDDLAG